MCTSGHSRRKRASTYTRTKASLINYWCKNHATTKDYLQSKPRVDLYSVCSLDFCAPQPHLIQSQVKSSQHLSRAAASLSRASDTLTRLDLQGRLVVDGRIAHALLDLACHGQECLLDILCILGRCLEEWDAEAVCEFLIAVSAYLTCHSYDKQTHLCNVVIYHFLVRHIALVSYQ